MTKAKGKQPDTSDETRCESKDDDGAQCLYVTHDDSIEHAFTTEQAEAAGAATSDATPEADVTTETAAEPGDGADGPAETPEPKAALPAARVSTNSWWCANCDTSSPHETWTCPKCGTPRLSAVV